MLRFFWAVDEEDVVELLYFDQGCNTEEDARKYGNPGHHFKLYKVEITALS